MKLLITSLIFLASFSTQAFTLISKPALKFGTSKVTINVTNDSCTNIGLTPEEFLTKIIDAMDIYWNSVSTSAIELKKGSVVARSSNSFTDFDTVADDMIGIGSSGTIIAACSSNGLFNGRSSTLGVGGIGRFGGVRGFFLINAQADSSVLTSSDQEVLAVIAHEVGHALGLAHSENEISLMYSSIGAKSQERLTIDDKDGITYLYPHDQIIPPSCGTISYVDRSGGGPGKLILTLSLMMLISIGFLRKNKPAIS